MPEMLNEAAIAAMIEKARARFQKDGFDVYQDFLDILRDAINGEDRAEPALEIAKTICELLEPERVGGITWVCVPCASCGGMRRENCKDFPNHGHEWCDCQ